MLSPYLSMFKQARPLHGLRKAYHIILHTSIDSIENGAIEGRFAGVFTPAPGRMTRRTLDKKTGSTRLARSYDRAPRRMTGRTLCLKSYPIKNGAVEGIRTLDLRRDRAAL